MLHKYVQTGHSLSDLPVQIMEDGRPVLHDMVTYLNEVPMGATTRHDQPPYQMLRPTTEPAASHSQVQSGRSPHPTSVSTISEPNILMTSPMQQELPLLEHDGPESNLDLQEMFSLMDTDAAEAAGLYWLQNYTA
jgi:hypothetical protein